MKGIFKKKMSYTELYDRYIHQLEVSLRCIRYIERMTGTTYNPNYGYPVFCRDEPHPHDDGFLLAEEGYLQFLYNDNQTQEDVDKRYGSISLIQEK